MELFATPCLKSVRTAFTHEHRNCITGEGNDTANSRMLVPTRKRLIVTTHVGSQKGIGHRSSLCLVHIQELTRNEYDNLNYRSEKHLKRLQNDSIMALLSFTKVAGEAGAISFWLVYSSNITVCEALALSEGGDKYQQDVALLLRSIITLRAFRESRNYRLVASS